METAPPPVPVILERVPDWDVQSCPAISCCFSSVTVSGISRTHTCLLPFRAVSRKVANAPSPLFLPEGAHSRAHTFRDCRIPRPFQGLWNKFHRHRARSGDARVREKRTAFIPMLLLVSIYVPEQVSWEVKATSALASRCQFPTLCQPLHSRQLQRSWEGDSLYVHSISPLICPTHTFQCPAALPRGFGLGEHQRECLQLLSSHCSPL